VSQRQKKKISIKKPLIAPALTKAKPIEKELESAWAVTIMIVAVVGGGIQRTPAKNKFLTNKFYNHES
jgi:hypothetical protein